LAEFEHKDWRGKTDGAPWMQRILIRLFRVLPMGLLYAVASVFVLPFYILFDRRGRRGSYRFARQLGMGRFRSVLHVISNFYHMGEVVLDRFAAYSGKAFQIVYTDYSVFERQTAVPENPLLMFSSHVGNYEMVGYTLPMPKPMKVLVYGGESATVMHHRNRLFSASNIAMVPVSDDLSHLFLLDQAISRGEIVSLPADRPFGSRKVLRLPFLGRDAAFPAGPFTLAVRREVKAIMAAYAIKEGRRKYRIILDELAIPETGSTQEKVAGLAAQFVSSLEKVAREWPGQWYNFYDFWQ